MTKAKWIVTVVFFAVLVLVQYVVHHFFGLNCWNFYTLIVYLAVFGITLVGLPLLIRLKSKDRELFIQGFLVFTVVQMLILMGLMAVALFKLNTQAINLLFQLLCVFFPVLIFQTTMLLLKLPKK